MQSPGHRANILNQRFRRVALGTYRDDAGLPLGDRLLLRLMAASLVSVRRAFRLEVLRRDLVEELAELLDLLFLLAGIRIDASSSTSSLAKIGTASRTARAIASEGRELTS